MDRRSLLRLLSLSGLASFLPPLAWGRVGIPTAPFRRADFGPDFRWGTAMAAYQVEGAPDVDGKGESIWDRFASNPRNIKDKSNGSMACDFYHRYPSDIELHSQLGFNAFRFSVAWSRVLPAGTGQVNQAGLDFYKRVADRCLELGQEPWVCLYHWDLPQVLEDKGGWTNRDIVGWFGEYTDTITRALGDRVNHWLVLNEPMGFTSLGYMTGLHAPGRKGFRNFLPAVHHAALCQAEGGRIIRANLPQATAGTTFSCAHVDPVNFAPRHQQAAHRLDVLLNRLFADPLFGKGYPLTELPFLRRIEKYLRPGDEEKLVHDFDFIGIQTYFRVVGRFSLNPPVLWANEVPAHKREGELTDMNWEVYPEGIYHLLKKFAQYPVKQIVVTENGAAFPDQLVDGRVNDSRRIQYFSDYLAQILRAKQEGVPVAGYFAWTFLDNFEWAEGYRPRFGIVYTDFETQQRHVKDSGLWFRELLGEI